MDDFQSFFVYFHNFTLQNYCFFLPMSEKSCIFATRLLNARTTCRDGIPCRLSLYILSFYNQKRGGAALNAPLSNHSKSFDEQDSSPAFVRLSIVRLDSRPPALQKHASLTKKRSVTLHSQKKRSVALHSQKKRSVALHSQKLKKCYAARSMAYIRWNNQWIEQGLINKENHGNYRKIA